MRADHSDGAVGRYGRVGAIGLCSLLAVALGALTWLGTLLLLSEPFMYPVESHEREVLALVPAVIATVPGVALSYRWYGRPVTELLAVALFGAYLAFFYYAPAQIKI